jgi:hypothetical protein
MQWRRIQEFPRYSVSDQGQVRNDESERLLSTIRTRNGNVSVSLWNDNRQHGRSLPLIVATAFVPKPQPTFNTPIHLNSWLHDNRASNLAWRPLWFAQKFTQQFNKDLGDAAPVKNITTGQIYDSVWDVVYEQGVLYNDVIKAIYHKTYVFPLMQCFEWHE